MIDYETFCRIHALHGQEGLTICQIAKALQLHEDTVSRWLKRARFVPRKQGARPSVKSSLYCRFDEMHFVASARRSK